MFFNNQDYSTSRHAYITGHYNPLHQLTLWALICFILRSPWKFVFNKCSCLIWQIISFILSPNKYSCVYAWTTLHWEDLRLTYRRFGFWQKNHPFRWSSFRSWRVCKQAIRDTENLHAYIEKPIHPKRVTFWCGFWSRSIIETLLSIKIVIGTCWTIFKKLFNGNFFRVFA